MYPMITANLQKLRENAVFLQQTCQRAGIRWSAVTKVVAAEPALVEALRPYADGFADSRTENLARIAPGKPRLLLRIGDPARAEDIVATSDMSLQSEIATIKALGSAARKQHKEHGVILMVDLGDLREGLVYSRRGAILKAARSVSGQEGLVLHGIGTNLTCFGGVLPSRENLGELCAIAEWLRGEMGLPLPLVSGGNSSSIGMLLRGEMPHGINHLRLGESLMLGRDTSDGSAVPGMHRNVFTLSAALGEVQQKPSRPIGRSGPNAFGEAVNFPDSGPMRRGIALIGRQDTDAEGLMPRDPRIKVLGASSDHLLLDLTAAREYKPGDGIHFDVNYGALLKAYTSRYVCKAAS